ncbi:50S ribosomal protein L25 [candidate division WWE3 bacterium]|nr:50S ribosomal protein L25 [candidate division WWE3 bacterium]
MSRERLNVQPRLAFGNKTKKLRRDGFVPANIYGASIESVSIQVDYPSFNKVMKQAGETDLIDIFIEGESDSRPVLIYDVQKNPITNSALHVDFFQVNMKEKVEVTVPIELIEEAPAVAEKRGEMLQTVDEVTIEVLPAEIPSYLELNLSSLKNVGDVLTYKDLVVPAGVELIIEDPEEVIVKIEQISDAAEELAKMDAETAVQQEARVEEAAATPTTEKSDKKE